MKKAAQGVIVHCVECMNAKVGGTPGNPMVRCVKGYREEFPLPYLGMRSFGNAKTCKDWEYAGDTP